MNEHVAANITLIMRLSNLPKDAVVPTAGKPSPITPLSVTRCPAYNLLLHIKTFGTSTERGSQIY